LRILNDLFQFKRKVQSIDVEIKVSILEIYLESFRDLLGESKKEVTLRETDDSASIPDLKRATVESIEEVYRLYKYAEKNRVVASTSMNDVSSRSHCLFFLDIVQVEMGSKRKKTANMPSISSRISIVDLAGSERIKRSEVEGVHMKEAQAINKSLSALGNVINGLYMDKKHIPFRDSKLTRILKPSFVGRKGNKVLLIANLSPTAFSVNESLSTLRFANRVKEIKTSSNVSSRESDQQKNEAAFVTSLRENERLSAIVRVMVDAFNYKPQIIHNKLINENTFDKDEDVDLLTKEGIREYQRYSRKQEDAQKQIRDNLLLEETKKLTFEQEQEIDKEINQVQEKIAALAKSLQEAKEIGQAHIRELERKVENQEHGLKATKDDVIKKEVEKIKFDALLKSLQREKERLEHSVIAQHQQHSNEISEEVNEWNREELRMEKKHRKHHRERQMMASLVELRDEQIKYHAQLQRFKALRTRADEVGEQVMFYEIRGFSKQLVHGFIDDAVRKKELQRLALTNEEETRLSGIISKRYPYDKEDILAQVLEYLKSGCMLYWRNHNLQQYFYLENASICWRESEDEPVNSNTVSVIPLDSITHVSLGKYELKKGRQSLSDTLRLNRSSSSLLSSPRTPKSDDTDFYLSFTVFYAKGRKSLDISATNSFDFEAWILGLSTLLEVEPTWGSPLELDSLHYGQVTQQEIDLCKNNHIRLQVYDYVKDIVAYLEVKDGSKLSRGQMRVLSKLDIIRSNVLYDYLYSI
jgi:hypothetical protein